MKLLRAAAALSAVLLLSAQPVPVRAGVEEEDIARVLAEFRGVLDEGRKHLGELDYPEAIEAFTKLIDAYKTGKIPMVTPDARQIVARSYEGRALALANLGRNPEASADFESLIRFDPSYAFDLKGISPKVVALYMTVRKKTIGVLSFEGDPLGSEVVLNDQSIGVTPLTDRDYISGTYHLRITHDGFDPLEDEIRVEAGGKTVKKYHLAPNSRSVLVATVPRDVKVIVDGRERGATFGSAGPDYEDVAKEIQVARSDISEPLLVEHLPPGEHAMVLRKECYEDLPVRVMIEVDPNNNPPLQYRPFVMDVSRGSLEIVSEPEGATVTLDGKAVGSAPLTVNDVCSGRHDLVMEKAGLGRSAATVEAKKNETVKVTRRLRLSIAALDMRPGLKEGESLGSALKGSERYNVLFEKDDVPQEVVDRVRLEMESAQGKGLSEKTLHDLIQSLKVELLALAVPAGPIKEQVDVLLYGAMQPVPDRLRLEASGIEGIRRVGFSLDSDLAVEMPWSGLKLIDVYGKRNPVVLGVTPNSPAALGGVSPGDLLVSASANPTANVADFTSVIRKSRAGDELDLTVETGGKTRAVKVKLLDTPVLLPTKDPDLLYNKAIADLQQAVALAPQGAARSYAWVNIGIALMHFGQYEAAVRDAFKKADLPDRAGISSGTVRYLMALCYEKLGLQKEAGASYQEAATSPAATLVSHDGPLLAPSAKRRAALLITSK